MDAADYQLHGKVAVIVFNNPPVNGLSFALRQAIVHYLQQANADANVQAIILTGSERAFSGGADVREFGTPLAFQEPILRSVIAAVEESPKPVIAAVDGVCLGGGFELALGAHFRVARATARVGLPEVNLGIIPGAGGTQRLPRAIGVERALDFLLSGQMVQAQTLADTSLFAEVVSDDLLPAAIDFAHKVIEEQPKIQRLSEVVLAPEQTLPLLQQRLQQVKQEFPHLPAQAQCVRAVQKGVEQGFDEGLKAERAYFLELLESAQSVALRYVFGAERAAARTPGVERDTAIWSIKQVGLLGTGPAAGRLAQDFAAAGLTVHWVPNRSADLSVFSSCSLLVEASTGANNERLQAFEAMRAARAQGQAGATLYLTSAAIPLDTLSAKIATEDAVLGLVPGPELFDGPLWEIRRVEHSRPEALATVLGLARKAGKKPVVGFDSQHTLGQLMFQSLVQAAQELVQLGVPALQIDNSLLQFGFKRGPLAAAKQLGLGHQAIGPDAFKADPALKDQDIIKACMAAMANQGAKLLEQNAAVRASDLDMACVLGFGLGRFIGGPMHYAQGQGLADMVACLKHYGAQGTPGAEVWKVAALIQKCAEQGGQWEK